MHDTISVHKNNVTTFMTEFLINSIILSTFISIFRYTKTREICTKRDMENHPFRIFGFSIYVYLITVLIMSNKNKVL